ncbi:hypothetical protein ACFQ1E_07900 [Sphingomonas canadensis]|uniref:Phage tail protein n=1 Tax=Sphingomonas canadensis TaxID=1219257 RepID=A0ABW3HAD3_9SPHN|nr:hypothetical protein [Sphingomonas canadensis]MCW3835959.1 hypothetical protein [Sphingomonas canadensis]
MRDFTGVSGANEEGLAKESPAPATRVPAAWLNAVTLELANVIGAEEAGSNALNPSDDTQLLTAILAMIQAGIGEEVAGGFRIGPFHFRFGTANAGSNSFGTAFPTACFGVWPVPMTNYNNGDEADEIWWVNTVTTDGFVINTSGSFATFQLSYVAIGK